MEEYTVEKKIKIDGKTLDKGGQLFIITEFPLMTFMQYRQDKSASFQFVWEESKDAAEILKSCKAKKKPEKLATKKENNKK
tara:strand:+ start:1892 stop:2134 length:243 start_codon:yes stop_codon:yes gene_type:complete